MWGHGVTSYGWRVFPFILHVLPYMHIVYTQLVDTFFKTYYGSRVSAQQLRTLDDRPEDTGSIPISELVVQKWLELQFQGMRYPHLAATCIRDICSAQINMQSIHIHCF